MVSHDETMKQKMALYLPQNSVDAVFELVKTYKISLKVVPDRTTKHGDYRRLPGGQHQITVNGSMNKYRFLLTLIHEIAHLVAFEKYGRSIKPHGQEWKHCFRYLMLPFIIPAIFPATLLPFLLAYIKNPYASTDTDVELSLALKQYDPKNDKDYIFELPKDSIFKIYNGRVFKKGNRLRKRYECTEVHSGRKYLFSPHVEVKRIS